MRYLSKINRGAILTAGVILIVIGYLITTAIIQNNEKPMIRQVCETYLKQEVAFNMLPLEYRKEKPDMGDTALKSYLAEMKKSITAFYPDNEQYYKYIIETLTSDLTNQAKGIDVVYQYEKTILKFKEISFEGDTANVTITCSSTIEAKNTATGSSIKNKTTAETSDSIILQKINGQWKVVYSSINRPTREYAVTKY